MPARPFVRIALPLVLVLVLVVACDNSKRNQEIAKVEPTEKAEAKDPEFDKRMEERKQKRLAEEKAKAETEAAKKAALEKVAVLPPKLPKKIDAACAAVGEAHERFMQRHHSGEVLEKWTASKDDQLSMTVTLCAKAGTLEVAGCQAYALDNAPAELKEDVPEILKACVDKFGPASASGAAAQAGGAIPKKPG